MPKPLDPSLAARLLRLGAWTRLNQIDAETRELRAAFPDLDASLDATGPARQNGRGKATLPVQRPERTPAQRKALSRAMKASWARRREAGA